MKLFFQEFYLLLGFTLLPVSLVAQPGTYISLKQKTDVIENSKKITNEVDLYFDNNKKVITKNYHSLKSFVMISNALGEIKTYYPGTNEVAYNQVKELSSQRNLIYFFANNLTDNLGLADEGFSLSSNTFEDQYNVTIWKAPLTLKGIDKVKMVFENRLPVYSEYQSNISKVLKKIYYTNYKDFDQFRLPLKIIEISYLPSGDSIVTRTIFSNVKATSTADDEYFNFKIPENAKPLGIHKDH
jgi:hypothetical protein